jgi:FkbM family methyltransferase
VAGNRRWAGLRRSAALARVRAAKVARVALRPRLWSPLTTGVLAAMEHAHVPFEHDFATVLDVGTSRGQFALFANSRWPAARIIGFEPLPAPAAIARRALPPGVVVHEVALGRRRTRATMNVAGQDDSSSLLGIGRQAVEFAGTAAVGEHDVEVRPLAEYLDRGLCGPTLLKIDAQGYELEVLRGAGPRLVEVDEVYCECSFVELYDGQPKAAEVVAFLHEHGFALTGVFGMTTALSGEQMQADLLFRNTRRPRERVVAPGVRRIGSPA